MSRRALLIGAGVCVVLLAVAVGIAVAVANAARTPEATVHEYLTRIAEGRGEAATAMVAPSRPGESRVLLGDRVLSSAVERISEITAELDQIDRTGRAYVDAGYRLGDERYRVRLGLVKDEPEWLVLDRWRIEDSLLEQVKLGVYGPGRVSIGGQPVSLEANGTYGRATLALYPGVYRVEPQQTRFLTAEPLTLYVSERGVPTSDVVFSPTPELTRRVQDRVDALLHRCVDAKLAADTAGCPFRSERRSDGTAVTWRVISAPKARVVDWGHRFEARGTAEAVYTDASGATSDRRETRFTVAGDLVIDADEVAVNFRDGGD